MKLFSQRKGLKPIKTKMQVDGMDDDLRVGLWNAVTAHYLGGVGGLAEGRDAELLIERIWELYLKWPLDAMDFFVPGHYKDVRKYFFDCEWFEVYDLVEFIVMNYPDEKVNLEFKKACNSVLERELSGYHFIGNKISPITSDEEISEIEKALTVPVDIITTHLERAVSLFSDRKSPDYRNSIKESISAVEAACKKATGNEKATLGQVLKELEDKLGLHPALKDAFGKFYGYTSAADGIRHAMMDHPNLGSEDAKLMLVTCSAFINYLKSKLSKAGIKL